MSRLMRSRTAWCAETRQRRRPQTPARRPHSPPSCLWEAHCPHRAGRGAATHRNGAGVEVDKEAHREHDGEQHFHVLQRLRVHRFPLCHTHGRSCAVKLGRGRRPRGKKRENVTAWHKSTRDVSPLCASTSLHCVSPAHCGRYGIYTRQRFHCLQRHAQAGHARLRETRRAALRRAPGGARISKRQRIGREQSCVPASAQVGPAPGLDPLGCCLLHSAQRDGAHTASAGLRHGWHLRWVC